MVHCVLWMILCRCVSSFNFVQFYQFTYFNCVSIHVLEVVLVFLSIPPYVYVKDMRLIVQMSLASHLDDIILH